MQARFYAPMYGRFLSPDPARDQHFEETQSWNIYSYVQNDPTMRIDPTGMIGGKELLTRAMYAILFIPYVPPAAAPPPPPPPPAAPVKSSDGGLSERDAQDIMCKVIFGLTPAMNLEVEPAEGESEPAVEPEVEPAPTPVEPAEAEPTSPEIKPRDLQGKTKEEIRQLADKKGLKPADNRPDKWHDPVTGKQRLRIDPGHKDAQGKPYTNKRAASDHVHGYGPNGDKDPILDPSHPDQDKHFPLRK